jgi:predicted metalloprotease
MRLGGEPESSNFEDRTGQSGGMSLGGGAGAGIFGLLFQVVASKFGIVGILVLALGYCALSSMGGIGGGGPTIGQKEGPSRLDESTRSFMTRTLGSTEEVWGELFQQAGAQYRPTTMVAYSNNSSSGCGAAQAAMGPFYCPSDQKIYIDPQFFNELKQRFGAPGDFAAGYVIAHEVGHHIQNLEGTLDRARQMQAQSGQAASNQVQVGVELQADCYAGVWAARARDAQGTILEPGDIEEGMRAAEAIGDDTLQRQTQGRVVPESFTHGSAAQRMEALQRGLKSGNPASCNYVR